MAGIGLFRLICMFVLYDIHIFFTIIVHARCWNSIADITQLAIILTHINIHNWSSNFCRWVHSCLISSYPTMLKPVEYYVDIPVYLFRLSLCISFYRYCILISINMIVAKTWTAKNVHTKFQKVGYFEQMKKIFF